jgi:hypothetical protein
MSMRNPGPHLLVSSAFLLLGWHGPDPETAGRIVAFARDRLGMRVGSGECTELVVAALEAAGISNGAARVPDVWGEPVEGRANIRPGDILQFRDAVFIGRRRVERDGRVLIQTYKRRLIHHTAIVEESRDDGRVLTVLHQNTGPVDAPDAERRRVRRDVIWLTDLRGGTVQVYRPVADAVEHSAKHATSVLEDRAETRSRKRDSSTTTDRCIKN